VNQLVIVREIVGFDILFLDFDTPNLLSRVFFFVRTPLRLLVFSGGAPRRSPVLSISRRRTSSVELEKRQDGQKRDVPSTLASQEHVFSSSSTSLPTYE
jgi:hypothetical protein